MNYSERRKLRSRRFQRAIELLLGSVAGKSGYDAVAVATNEGLLVAANGDEEQCDVLAAYAPIVSRSRDVVVKRQLIEMLEPYLPGAHPDGIHFRPFEANGERMFFCAMVNRGEVDRGGVFRAITGVRRIAADPAVA